MKIWMLPSLLLLVCLTSACSILRPAITRIKAPGVEMVHNKDVQTPPQISTNSETSQVLIPAGAKIVVRETEPLAAQGENKAVPAQKETTIELPKDKGAEIVSKAIRTDAKGSGGFTPPPPPTPFQKSLGIWPYFGAGMVVLGVFLCTPWGGQNFRLGAIVAAGGIGMTISANLIDQIKLPFPAIFMIFLILALAVYYGYRVRHSQIEKSTTV